MGTDLLERPVAAPPVEQGHPVLAPAPPRRSLRERWAERRRRAAQDRLRREEADRLECAVQAVHVLEQAAEQLEAGWVQDAWFSVRLRSGRQGSVGPLDLPVLGRGATVTGACLVGAVVQAAGGGQHARAVTFRALDLLWTQLHGEPAPAACSPTERAARVRELTRWNDARERNRDEVLGLVESTRHRALAAL